MEPQDKAINARLDLLGEQIAYLVERQRKQEELFAEMSPILKEVMATATTRLDDLDRRGVFSFGRELVKVGERVVENYSPEDVHKLGDAVVSILDTVRAMTQPEVLMIAGEASEVLQKADDAEPIGIMGMVRASRNEEVQKGMAVMMELLRHVGRAATAVAEQRKGKAAPAAGRKAGLAAQLAPRRSRKVLGVERSAAPPVAKKIEAAPQTCATPRPPGEVAAVIDGVGFTADGHLSDPKSWTRALGESIAAAQDVELGPEHWKLVDFARADFDKTGVSPNVRRITQGTGMSTKDLYALFPKAPARTLAKIAGVPKPAGCI